MGIKTGLSTSETFLTALEAKGPFTVVNEITGETVVIDKPAECSTPGILSQVLSQISGTATDLKMVDEEGNETTIDITDLREEAGITGYDSTNEMVISTVNN